MLLQRSGCRDQAPPRANDHEITRTKALVRAIVDWAHAFCSGLILHEDAADTRVALVGPLSFPIDLVVIGTIRDAPESAVPIGRVRQCLSYGHLFALELSGWPIRHGID